MNKPLPSRLTGPIRVVLCGLALGLASTGLAQLLIEVSVVAAASAQLNPAIQLPGGSYRVTGQVPPGLLKKVDGGSGYRDWEAYSARGLAARLFPAHLHQLTNSFAMAGYFEQSRSERNKGKEKHSSRVFVGDDGSRTLLYVIETADELVWLIARGN